MPENRDPLKCTLYVFPFSLYSIMARFTATLGASTGPASEPITIETRLVNLHCGENIGQEYLLDLNPKGQVPTMTVEGLPSPLTDSLDISYWFCRKYPRLLPEQHQEMIGRLLNQLHAIEALSLSAKPPDQPEEDVVDPACDVILANNGINAEYRQALEYKKEVDRGHMLKSLHHASIEQAEDQSRFFFGKILEETRKYQDESPWVFGGDVGPTVLDAHLVAFIGRIVEAGRARLVPDDLNKYAQRIMTLPEWLQVTHGRRTLWEISYGHVHLLSEI